MMCTLNGYAGLIKCNVQQRYLAVLQRIKFSLLDQLFAQIWVCKQLIVIASQKLRFLLRRLRSFNSLNHACGICGHSDSFSAGNAAI